MIFSMLVSLKDNIPLRARFRPRNVARFIVQHATLSLSKRLIPDVHFSSANIVE